MVPTRSARMPHPDAEVVDEEDVEYVPPYWAERLWNWVVVMVFGLAGAVVATQFLFHGWNLTAVAVMALGTMVGSGWVYLWPHLAQAASLMMLFLHALLVGAWVWWLT